jgi:hypothetical protein
VQNNLANFQRAQKCLRSNFAARRSIKISQFCRARIFSARAVISAPVPRTYSMQQKGEPPSFFTQFFFTYKLKGEILIKSDKKKLNKIIFSDIEIKVEKPFRFYSNFIEETL